MQQQNFIQKSFVRLFNFILVTSVLCGALPVQAQKRAAATKTSQNKNVAAQNQPAAKCNGGWSGIVTFSGSVAKSPLRYNQLANSYFHNPMNGALPHERWRHTQGLNNNGRFCRCY